MRWNATQLQKNKANYAMTQLNLINVSENANHTAHLLGYSICMKLQRQQRQISICLNLCSKGKKERNTAFWEKEE